MLVVKWYSKQLKEKPIITKCVSSFITSAIGDTLCQKIHKENKFNFVRTLKQASFGFLTAPYFHFQFSILYPWLFPTITPINLLKLVVFNQATTAPVFITLFYIYIDAMSGKNIEEIRKELNHKFLPTYMSNIKVWPAIVAFNVTIVPVNWRVLFVNVVGVVWSTYLSYMKNVESIGL